MKISPQQKKEIFEWIQTICIALIVAFVVRQFLFQPYKVQMGSMLPTLKENNLIIVNKLLYRFKKPNRGDIVVFVPPGGDKQVYYVKRIIGLPGETIEVKEGSVYINNEKLKESYLQIETPGKASLQTLKPNEFFVMGDHRNNSLDSRDFGPIELKSISGRAILVFWPLQSVKLLSHVVY
jgi:signal peptidase I